MKITQFDRTNLRLIAEDLKTAIKSVEEKYGISLVYNNARYDANTATFKIEGRTIGESGTVNTPEREHFLRFCESYGLTKDMLDKEIYYVNEAYFVRGLNTRSPKFCVVAERSKDGKQFKLTPEGVKSAWARLHPQTVS